MTIDWNPLIEKCHAAAVANGWWEQPRAIEETLMLVVTEVAEAVEWYRDCAWAPEHIYKPFRFDPDLEYAIAESECHEKYGKGTYWQAYKPVGIPSELADVAIRVCDLMGHHKCSFVQTECLYMVADKFIVECAELSAKVLEAMNPIGLSEKLSRVLAMLEYVSAHYGIDLAAAIETKLAYNATRGHRHGGKRA